MDDHFLLDGSPKRSEQASGPSIPGIQTRLITLLHEMYDSQQAIVLTLDDEDRQAIGTFSSWSMKDTLAHIVAWTDVLNIRLDQLAHEETPVDYEDIDQINAEFFYARSKLSWSAVLEASRKAYNGLVERIRSIPEKYLIDPERYAWLHGEPLWRRILTSAYVHPLIHLAYYFNQHDQAELGLAMQEDAAGKLLAFAQDLSWHSEVLYNLACQYALSGDKATAIAKLRQALNCDATLLEWSQEDPDFSAIKNDPEFKAVYAEFK